MRVLRVFHGSRIRSHRARDRALTALGLDVTLVVPAPWPEAGAEDVLSDEPFRMIEAPVTRPGDVNRHRYDEPTIARILRDVRPDVLDLHAEPVSVAARQWLQAAPAGLPVAMYTAQNVDKRYPPPFAQYEESALARVQAMYPCSCQAASVARGKGFAGHIDVLPLGYDPDVFFAGEQSHDDTVLRLGLVGRMVPQKGVRDAVRILDAIRRRRPARLELIGDGPEISPALALAADLGIADLVDVRPWIDTPKLAEAYRSLHIVLIPSVATSRWIEQFGRVIVEAQASGSVPAGYFSGSIPEVMAGAGVLAAEGDVAGLIHAVEALIDDAATFDRLRHLGLVLSRRRAWPPVAERHAALLRSALDPVGRYPTGREQAVAEFGAPAAVLGQTRPFAVPVLRDSPGLGHTLGTLVDLARKR